MGLQSAEIELTLERLKSQGATQQEIEAALQDIHRKYEDDQNTRRDIGRAPTVPELRHEVEARFPSKKKAK